MAYLNFCKIAKQLRMLDAFGVTFSRLRHISETYLNRHVLNARSKSLDMDLHETWFEICKIHGVLTLEDIDGQHFRVAVYLESDPDEISIIQPILYSSGFNSLRRALNIQRHWIVCMDPELPPAWQQVVDVFYQSIDQPNVVDVIDLLCPAPAKVRSRSRKSAVLTG